MLFCVIFNLQFAKLCHSLLRKLACLRVCALIALRSRSVASSDHAVLSSSDFEKSFTVQIRNSLIFFYSVSPFLLSTATSKRHDKHRLSANVLASHFDSAYQHCFVLPLLARLCKIDAHLAARFIFDENVEARVVFVEFVHASPTQLFCHAHISSEPRVNA